MTGRVQAGLIVATLLPAAAIVACGKGEAGWSPLALVNETPSVPKGLYLRSPGASIAAGAIVAIRQPVRGRAYLAGLGLPAEVLLLKRVAATRGARVCATAGALRWAGGVERVLARDGRGAPLPSWSGCRTLADDELLVLGDTPTSFDSRYFGPVSRAAVRGVYREVLAW